MEKGDQAVRENYTILKGALTSLPIDSWRHGYLMSNLDRLWEAYLRVLEAFKNIAGDVEPQDYGLVKKRAGVSTVSSTYHSLGSEGSSSSTTSATSDSCSESEKETNQE
jgi:hypothetical protein